jgi:hypothetical protein
VLKGFLLKKEANGESSKVINADFVTWL